MPEATSPDGASQQDEGVTIPRLSVKEVGFTGLKVSNGQILQEQQRVFRYPHFLKVIEEIRANPTVGAAMNVYRNTIARKKWCVEAEEDSSDIVKQRAEIIESMMHDMEDSWETFILSIIPYLEFGYSIHEIVPYRRLKRNGSRENDGLVGIRKLAIRNQETVSKWVFSEDGRELLRVEQSLTHLENSYRFQNLLNENGLLEIPRKKFLLFTANGTAGNPQGNSIYKNIYLAHKQLSMLQEQQLLTVAKEAKGLMKIEVPSAYLAEDAPDGGQAATAFKAIIDGHNNGTNSGLLVPQEYDQDAKMPMFNYNLLESKGTPAVIIEDVVKRLQRDILVNMSVDGIALGTDGSGSFALAESKTSMTALAIDARLKEIQNVLNSHLMKFIHEANGWDTSEMPKFIYEDDEDIDIEAYGSFVQKIFSTGAIEFDRPVANRIRKFLGVPEKDENEPVNVDQLPSNMSQMQSRSGDGMAVGTSGNGTAKINGDSKNMNTTTANVANK